MALRPYDDFWTPRRRRFVDPFLESGMLSRNMMTSDDLMTSSPRDWATPYVGRRQEMMPWRHRDEGVSDMERKFHEMVRKVDARFSGIFSLLDDDELFDRQQVEVEHEGKKIAGASPTKDFALKIDVQDFRPEEVKVKVQGGQVFVHAKRENKNEGEGMYAYSFREFKRAFTVPQGVDVERLTSSLSSTGILQIDAPVKTPAMSAIEPPRSVPVPVTVEHGDK